MTYDARAAGAECDKCPLNGRHKPVPPSPPKSGKIKLVIVGEGPGGVEIFRSEPFVGPSGMMLNSMLERAGFDRADAWITNSAMCRGFTEWEKERAASCCAGRLAKELKDIPDEVPTLAFGNVASFQLLGKRAITKSRGFVWRVPPVDEKNVKAARKQYEKQVKRYGANTDFALRADSAVMRQQARVTMGRRVVIPTFHPAMVLRGSDGVTSTLYTDLKRAVRYAKAALHLEHDEPFVIAKTPDEAREALAKLGRVVAVDVETDGIDVFRARMTCASVSDGSANVPTVVLMPWTPDMGCVLDEALADRVVVTHNGPAFDDIVLLRHGVDIIASDYDPQEILQLLPDSTLEDVAMIAALGIKRLRKGGHKNRHDTLIAFHGFASHLRKGLGNVAALYCDTGPWKLDFKEAGAEDKGGTAKKNLYANDSYELALYNAADSRLTIRPWHRMQPDLQAERAVYEHDMQLAYVCQQMQINGFAFDHARRDELSGRLAVREKELLAQLKELAGDPDFDPAKPVHVRRALFDRLGGKVIKKTKTGLAHTGAETLEAFKTLNTDAGRLADHILRWRACAKTKSTFVDGVLLGPDGRVHSNWRSFGTRTGRLSGRTPNLQNLTRAVLSELAAARIKELTKAGMKPGDAMKMAKAELAGDLWELETRVREQYIAKPGRALIYFDLSQSEMRFAAYASGDSNFIASCESGDVHTANACILFPEAADMLRADPKGRGKRFRDITKNAGFGIIYLAEIPTIYAFLCAQGFANFVTIQSVEAMFAHIYKYYARYYEFCEERAEYAREHGYLRTIIMGRKRWMGRRQSEDSDKGYENQIANYSIQSGIADLMNMRLIDMSRKLPPGARLVAQIHDAVIIEAREGECARLTKQLVLDTWGQEIVMPHNGLKWVMPVDFKMADRWSDLG